MYLSLKLSQKKFAEIFFIYTSYVRNVFKEYHNKVWLRIQKQSSCKIFQIWTDIYLQGVK